MQSSNFDVILKSLFAKYDRNKKPIQISFRKIAPTFNIERATHLIHPYPAKLLGHIPFVFLNSNLLSKNGDTVLDPFCGSGTVLLESVLAGRNAIGADSNPLARLISKVKTYKYSSNDLRSGREILCKALGKVKKADIPNVVNVDYWFLPHVKVELALILRAIKEIDETRIREFFLVCFSNCVKKVSLADPRVSVPVRLRKDQYKIEHPFRKKTREQLASLKSIDVRAKFMAIVEANIKRNDELKSFSSIKNVRLVKLFKDSRALKSNQSLKSNSVDLVISSPPYAGAQKYIRSSSLSLGWLEFADVTELKSLDKLNIGRENYRSSEYNKLLTTEIPAADKILKEIWKTNPLRAHIAANYLLEMRQALVECIRVMKPNAYFVLVAANNMICGRKFKTQEYLTCILEGLGLESKLKLIDDIKSYGLMTKRNKTASIITREWIVVFRKNQKLWTNYCTKNLRTRF